VPIGVYLDASHGDIFSLDHLGIKLLIVSRIDALESRANLVTAIATGSDRVIACPTILVKWYASVA